MKIRILNNSIRLRLSQPEVAQLASKGSVHGSTVFGVKATFHYNLHRTDQQEISADLQAYTINIFLPKGMVSSWANSNEVTIYQEIENGSSDKLAIRVEKDFKCLTTRPGENESNLFPNPNQKHV